MAKSISFGHSFNKLTRFIEVNIRLDLKDPKNCIQNNSNLYFERTFKAFLLSDGKTIESANELKEYLFENNKLEYPNGSLLHVKQTDEVFVLTHGKKMLITSPQLFELFGWSWDNLIDIDKAKADKIANTDPPYLSISNQHPAGTLIKSYPSGKYYLVWDKEKLPIASSSIVQEVLDMKDKELSIAVTDRGNERLLSCPISSNSLKSEKISCLFDEYKLRESLGNYYYFYFKLPDSCDLETAEIEKVNLKFITDKSSITVRQSLKDIIASLINRYAYK